MQLTRPKQYEHEQPQETIKQRSRTELHAQAIL